MSLKLYRVDVENTIYVLAEDNKSAEKYVEIELDRSDALEGANFFSRLVEPEHVIASEWKDSIPFMSSKDEKNEENLDNFEDKTCEDIMLDMAKLKLAKNMAQIINGIGEKATAAHPNEND